MSTQLQGRASRSRSDFAAGERCGGCGGCGFITGCSRASTSHAEFNQGSGGSPASLDEPASLNLPAPASEPQLPPDQFLHDLVGAGPDLGDPGVAPGAGHAVLVHEAVATVDLDAVVDDVVLHVGGPPLGLRGLDRGQLPL